jgi:aldehyde:ferredoxin oxidoreductase
VSGSGRTDISDRGLLDRAREEIIRLTSASPVLLGELGISNFGTGALLDLIQSRRMLPTDNFRATSFESAATVNAFSYKTKYHTKKTGCTGCHVLCKKKGEAGGIMPEYETMSHFTALVGNTDLDAVVEANRICNEAGMDTITAAVTLSCFREITGAALSPRDIISLLEDIAASRGVGAELKLGSYRYAESRGRPEISMSVKKLELPAYDPRGARGMALAYAVSTRGGCHLRAYPISHEILRKPVATDRFTFSGKARIIKIAEDLNAVIDSLTACKFLFFAATLEEYALAFQAVTGVPATAQDLLRAGERIYYRERMMNARNGFTSADDDLPARFFTMAGTGGDGIAVPAIDRSAFLKARADYYIIRGLDERGLPTERKAKELGLI